MAHLKQWKNKQNEVTHWINHCSGEVRVWDSMPETWSYATGQWRLRTANEQFKVPKTRADRKWNAWTIFPGDNVFPAMTAAAVDETQPVAGQSSQAVETQPVAGQEVVEILLPTGTPIPACTEIQSGTPRPNWDDAASTIAVPDREGQGFFFTIHPLYHPRAAGGGIRPLLHHARNPFRVVPPKDLHVGARFPRHIED